MPENHVQDIFVRLIPGVRRPAGVLLHRRFGGGGFPPPAAVGFPDGALQHRVVPLQRSPGPQGQEVPDIAADFGPEAGGLLPVGLPEVPVAAGGPPRQGGGQTAQHQGEAQQQTEDACPGPEPGVLFRLHPEDAGGVLRPVQGLMDPGGHIVLQIFTGVFPHAVPFCIQFPTPP